MKTSFNMDNTNGNAPAQLVNLKIEAVKIPDFIVKQRGIQLPLKASFKRFEISLQQPIGTLLFPSINLL